MQKKDNIHIIAVIGSFLIPLASLLITTYHAGYYPIIGDDIWGATVVQCNPLNVIVFTLRWDLHPPLYYSLLDMWALLGNSDFWLRSSSIFLHALLTACVFIYVINKKSLIEACIASVLVFSSPFLLSYSTSIRMYPLIALLSFIQFILVSKYIDLGNKYLKWVLVNALLITYAHAIGITFVFFHFLFGLLMMLGQSVRKKIIPWTVGHGLVFLLSIFVVINSALKSVSHAGKPGLSDLVNLVHGMFIDGNIFFAIVPLVIVMLSLRYKTQRAIFICYLVIPVATFFMVSYFIKPIWLTRNFVFAMPVICIALASTITELRINKRIMLLLPAFIATLNCYNWEVFKYKSQGDDFTSAVIEIEKELEATESKLCVISGNQLNTFWSLERYLNGNHWGEPVETRPPLNQRWTNISNKFPDILKETLALTPAPNYTENDRLIVSSGFTERCRKADVSRILLLEDGGRLQHADMKAVFKNSSYTVYDWTVGNN